MACCVLALPQGINDSLSAYPEFNYHASKSAVVWDSLTRAITHMQVGATRGRLAAYSAACPALLAVLWP
jgi:hypothetical protein